MLPVTYTVAWTPPLVLAMAASRLAGGLPRAPWAAEVLAEQTYWSLQETPGALSVAAGRLMRSTGKADRGAVAAAIDALVLTAVAVPRGSGRSSRLALLAAAELGIPTLTAHECRALSRAAQRAEAMFVAWSNKARAAAERRSGTVTSGTSRRQVDR